MGANEDRLMTIFKEGLSRLYAEEPDHEITKWLLESLGRAGGYQEENAVLRWHDSFEWYRKLLENRKLEAQEPEDKRKVIDFPWASWRRYVNRLRPGTLMVLAAPDGAGKSAYAEVIADWWTKRGLKVAYIHFELNRELVLDRRTARHARIPVSVLDSGKLTPEQEYEIEAAQQRLREWTGEITYVHTPGWTMERTIQKLHELHEQNLVDVVIIDYLEKCSPSQLQVKLYGAQVYQREANDVENLKNWCEAFGVPALLLSQFGKEGKKKEWSDISRVDIRGAGEKTEKANVVYVFQGENDTDESGRRVLNGRIDKNTMGPTGSIKQMMIPEFFTITDIL